MLSVYQQWDPLKACVVGRSYPPEFYSWIQVPHVRDLFERIAIETEEDYQYLIRKLESFGVKVLRPELPTTAPKTPEKFLPPPMYPRDAMVTIGQKLYTHIPNLDIQAVLYYNDVKDPSWPNIASIDDFHSLPDWIQREIKEVHGINFYSHYPNFKHIFDWVSDQGTDVVNIFSKQGSFVNGSMCSRIGRDLYFGTPDKNADINIIKNFCNQHLSQFRNHIIETEGHSDGVFSAVCPGLIVSLFDVPTYADTFPGWEVVYLPGQSWDRVRPFLDLKKKNKGKWWIPGFEYDQAVIDCVETWLTNWVGYVEETVFDVNMLTVDPKNVLVFGHNETVFRAMERHGITPHIVPFRHRYFWDGGLHCVTSDLDRAGTMQDYFPERG